MNIHKGLILKNENPKILSITDLNKIHEIEQDMWAEGIGEYVKCNSCDIIFSKKDIFGYLKETIYQETVGKIEKILNIESIECKKCKGNTDFIWGIDYLKEIKERYLDNESFLTTIRNDTGEILGFTDGYISDFDTIYQREFEYYYSNIGKKRIKTMLESKLSQELPEVFLMHPVVALSAKHSNLQLFLAIIQHFYLNINDLGHQNLTGIYEAHIGDIAHSLYHTFGGQRILTSQQKGDIYNRNCDNISDILIHKDIINTTLEKLSYGYKNFIKQNSSKMKEVLIR